MVSDKKGVIFPNFQFLKSNLFLPTETQTSLGFRAGMFSSGWRLILNFYWEKTMIRLNLKNDLGSLHISPEPHCKFKLVIIWPRSIIRNVHYLSLLSTFLLLNLLIFITCPKVCVGGGGKGGGEGLNIQKISKGKKCPGWQVPLKCQLCLDRIGYIRPKPDDRINKNWLTELSLPYDQTIRPNIQQGK